MLFRSVGTEPQTYCDTHVAITVCKESGKPASPFCPEDGLKTTAYISGGSPGTEDGAYLLPSKLSTDTCPVHATRDIETIDIDGDTGVEDEPEEEFEEEEETEEPPDSHEGLEDAEQTLIFPEDISD